VIFRIPRNASTEPVGQLATSGREVVRPPRSRCCSRSAPPRVSRPRRNGLRWVPEGPGVMWAARLGETTIRLGRARRALAAGGRGRCRGRGPTQKRKAHRWAGARGVKGAHDGSQRAQPPLARPSPQRFPVPRLDPRPHPARRAAAGRPPASGLVWSARSACYVGPDARFRALSTVKRARCEIFGSFPALGHARGAADERSILISRPGRGEQLEGDGSTFGAVAGHVSWCGWSKSGCDRGRAWVVHQRRSPTAQNRGSAARAIRRRPGGPPAREATDGAILDRPGRSSCGPRGRARPVDALIQLWRNRVGGIGHSAPAGQTTLAPEDAAGASYACRLRDSRQVILPRPARSAATGGRLRATGNRKPGLPLRGKAAARHHGNRTLRGPGRTPG